MSDRYVKAWNDYTRSESFLKSSEPSTIGASEVQRHFLENRLKHAFDEGWNRRAPAEVDREALVEEVSSCIDAWGELRIDGSDNRTVGEVAADALIAYLAEREGRA